MKGIITIAGYGTRFLPASKAVPKEMFPIAGKPLIQYHVESLVAAGITEIIIVVRDGGEIVQRHFAPNRALEEHLRQSGKLDTLDEVQRLSRMADIVTVRQSDTLPYGNASPALAARPWLDPGEPFYYMFGDDLIIADVPVPRQVRNAFDKHHPAAVLAAHEVPDRETHLYGCIAPKPGSEHGVAGIVEKPPPGTAPSNLVQIGHFLFTPVLFEVLDGLSLGKGGELWLADGVDRLAALSSVVVCPIEGTWLAAGDPMRQLKASIEMTLQRDGLRDGLVSYLRSLKL